MWQPFPQSRGRGTGLLAPQILGRGSNPIGNYPLTLGFNQYPQPQQGSSQGFGPQNYNYNYNYNNRPPNRDRRPRQHGYSSFYDDGNSSYSSNASRRGYSRGGNGQVNAAMSNLPPRPPSNDKKNKDRDRGKGSSRADNKKDNKDITNENRMLTRTKQQGMETQYRSYLCPKCGEDYNFRQINFKFVGKVPLILNCNHTMCQECTYQNLKNYKVNCPTCETDSIVAQEDTPVCQTDMQYVFPPNFYIFGIIAYYRPQGGYMGNLDSMKFVSTAKKNLTQLPDPADRCCFGTCSKPATMYCPSCEGIYCVDCCTVVHKSVKKMMTHEPVPRSKSKFSLLLENCGDHPQMEVEFFCKACDSTACCYCVLDKHTDHDRVPLYFLGDEEMEEFKRLKKNAEKALREVLCTQKKTARLVNFNTGAIKKEVCQYFADCHAKIELLEKKMFDQLESVKITNRGLDGIQASLMKSAEQLKQLVAFNEDKIGDKKFNLKGALDKLRDLENMPRFLLNENGHTEPVRFVVNTAAIEALDENFVIEKCDDSKYSLLTEKELPEGYVVDIDESDSEVEGNIVAIMSENIAYKKESNPVPPPKTATSASNSVSSKRTQKKVRPSHAAKKQIDMEKVIVQHINSMDSFFIQYKGNQTRLIQLNEEIENVIKMGGAQSVQDPQLNNLYLVLYIDDSKKNAQKEQKWLRGRITEIKNSEKGPLYEVFLIDYGKNQTVDGTRIKEIMASLAQKKPFAIECMLYNPMNVNWSKRAHYSMAKILNDKEVSMMIKSINCGVYEVDLMIASSDGDVASVYDILVHTTQSVEARDDGSADGSMNSKKEVYYPSLKVYGNSKKFQKNQKERVRIANIVDPENIFVHLVQHEEAFKNMSHAIKKAYKHAKHGCIPIEGSYVLVEHEDVIRSNWHRALVKSVDLIVDQVQVLLVDWGTNVVVPSSNVKPLQECFTRLECQAVPVKMAHIAPYNAQRTWSAQATAYLQTYRRSQDVLKMVVQDVAPDVRVALFDCGGNVDLCINALMVENNLADSTGPISTKLEWPQFETPAPAFSDGDGLMASMIKKADEQANQDSDEDDEESTTDVRKRQVTVVKVEGPDCIWVKFLDFRERESNMFKELQVHYSEEQKTKDKWEIEEHCVVDIDNEYARGKIREKIKEGHEYKVYLYDKVAEVIASIDKIYVYDKYFMRFPQAVTKSHLANIKPAGDTGKWSISSIEALQELFSKHTRIYVFKALEADEDLSLNSLPLDMWYGVVIPGGPTEPDKLKYVYINNFLVKLGLAYKIPKPKPIIPKASTSALLPVKKAKSADGLLKGLYTAETKSPVLEENKETESASNSEEKQVALELLESPEKKKKQNKSPRTEKTQCMKILESLNKTSKEVENTFDKKTEDDKKEDSVKSWSLIVEQELGEPSVKPKSLQNIESDVTDNNEGSPYRKKEVVIDDWLPPFRLTKREFKARVTCIETCGHLFLHEEDMDQVYYKMEANIKEYFDGNHPQATDHQWQPGQLCTIKYTDNKWYRGKILKVKNPDKISVFMIDFGSDHDLSPEHLFREILYTDIGAFATKVKLDKVYCKTGSWLASDYDRFHDLVSDWCRVVVHGPLEVELPLVEVYNENGDCVNERLVELCPGLTRCPPFAIQQEEEEEEEETIIIENMVVEETPLSEEMLTDELNEILDEKTTRDPNIPVFPEPNLVYKKRPLPKELLEGKKVLLEIGGIMDYNKVVLKTPGVDVSEEMYDLIMDIQDSADSLPLLKDIRVGTPCLAPYSEDGVWYRARITNSTAADLGFVDVLFVDYGNSEAVSVQRVKKILSNYMELPQQTWEAALNVVLKEDVDAVLAMQAMNSLDKKKRYVQLVKKEPLTVDIYENGGTLSYQSLFSSGAVKTLYDENN